MTPFVANASLPKDYTTLNVRTGIVFKFNSAGTYQFFRIVNSSGGACLGQCVAVSSNSFVFSGWYTGTASLLDTYNSSIISFPSSSSAGGFVVKFDLTGAYINSQFVDSTSFNESNECCGIDKDGNVLFGGYYYTNAANVLNQAGTTLFTMPAGTVTNTQTNFFCKANI